MQQSVTSQPLHLDETSQIGIKYILFLCHFSRFLHNNPFVFQQNYWILLRKWTFKYFFFIKNTKVNVVKSSINSIKYLLLPWEVVHIRTQSSTWIRSNSFALHATSLGNNYYDAIQEHNLHILYSFLQWCWAILIPSSFGKENLNLYWSSKCPHVLCKTNLL